MTDNVKIKEGAAALSQALTAAGIKGPVVIRLTAADGAAFLEAANNSIPMTERDGVRACSIEEITFMWRPGGDDDVTADGGTF